MKSFVLLGSAVSLASAMCSHGTSLSPRSDNIAAPSFGYTGTIGPLGWHSIASGNLECATGEEQSPIDILPGTISSVSGTTLDVQLQNYAHGAELENLGTTLEAFVNGTMFLNNKVHSLRQFHFHTPSEHRIDGEHYPMEVHFVFESADHDLAVLGFLIEVAGPAELSLAVLRNVFRHVEDASELGEVAHTGALNFDQLRRHVRDSDVFQYSGSLTTPPCAQDVAFNIVRNPINIDVSVYKRVKKILKFNSRYTQNHPGEKNLLDYARDILDAN